LTNLFVDFFSPLILVRANLNYRRKGQLDHLPSRISFSWIHIPGASTTSQPIKLARRDLYDARFQLIAESEQETGVDSETKEPSALDFVEAPSDLVPGVYEGGLKTWECSVDLVSYMDSLQVPISRIRGKRILEVSGNFRFPEPFINLFPNRLGVEQQFPVCISFTGFSSSLYLLKQTRRRQLFTCKTITFLFSGSSLFRMLSWPGVSSLLSPPVFF
jgi:hypothetical protein